MSQYHSSSSSGAGAGGMCWDVPGECSAADPTYYDVLKCEGEFATPSQFFQRGAKPARAHSAFPWPAVGSSSGNGGSAADNKHRLRRSTAQSAGGSAYQPSESAGSAALLAQADGALPASVFRLPTGRAAGDEPWALRGMTAGGRALRSASQVTLSRFDRKVALV
ncbi:hypothetical protein IWQ56_001757 [Coemansia nantahalensis]|nr:hypothetical protein IWQ56_001757 [Coemansia nantahalensis]